MGRFSSEGTRGEGQARKDLRSGLDNIVGKETRFRERLPCEGSPMLE